MEQIVLPYNGTGRIQVGMDSRGEAYECQVESGAEVTVFTQSAEKETKMVRLKGESETDSHGPGDLEASSRKRGHFQMCIGSVTSEVDWRKTERDESYLRNFL